MKYKLNKIVVDKKEGIICLEIKLESEVENHVITEKFSEVHSDLKKYRIGDGELIIKFDSDIKELEISNSNSIGENTFRLKNICFFYNDSFITKLVIEFKENHLEIPPKFYIFEGNFRNIIEESIDNLKKLSEKLNQEYQEICLDSINHLEIIQKHFPCFLSSWYHKLIKRLEVLDLQEAKELLEIIKDSTKSECIFAFGKKEEERIDLDDIDEDSDYDEEKRKIEIFHKQQRPVLRNNLKTIIKILSTKRYVTKIERTKLIMLKRLVRQIEYVHVDPKRSLLDDIKNILSEILGVISNIAGPLFALISVTIGIINTVKKVDEIKDNLKNKKYKKDTFEYLGSQRKTYEKRREVNNVETYRQSIPFRRPQPKQRPKVRQKGYYSKKQVVDMIAKLLKKHGTLTKYQILNALRPNVSLGQVENAIYNNYRFIKTRDMIGRCHRYRLRKKLLNPRD